MDMTVADMRRMHDAHPQIQILLEWDKLVYSGRHEYSDFVSLVERAVIWAAAQMSENPKEITHLDENALTYQLVKALRAIAFDASLDSTVGGHCDLVVRYGDRYLWLGEAKIYKGYTWLTKGYLQLTTRYSTGLEGQDCGALIIYFKSGDMAAVMTEWSARLGSMKSNRNGAPIVVAVNTPPACSVVSTQAHHRSGRDFVVKHLPISIVWDPAI
ncbi:hypothetical protein [uncultured Stenotrophomonas sp.]|uniref:hypothetical protein n=1 Tax=uncultured Stenotrophomonas sp. TaxID=165438 RepID=UPI0025D48CC0|nr:hypothetical protein [uncultured Stenotrophomonas sp.]